MPQGYPDARNIGIEYGGKRRVTVTGLAMGGADYGVNQIINPRTAQQTGTVAIGLDTLGIDDTADGKVLSHGNIAADGQSGIKRSFDCGGAIPITTRTCCERILRIQAAAEHQ
ncbi:hypothetical protein D3C71_1813940 [compost metagenome]